MGYRDDFYTTDNIIGYTGNLQANATVYFQKNDGRERSFGRITQDHDLKLNIGRNKVRTTTDYVVENRNIQGGLRCVEYYNGKVQHTSRNVFVPVGGLSAVQRSILQRAIYNFPERKGKDSASQQAKLEDRMTPTRAARLAIGKGNTSSLLVQHEQMIEDAQQD